MAIEGPWVFRDRVIDVDDLLVALGLPVVPDPGPGRDPDLDDEDPDDLYDPEPEPGPDPALQLARVHAAGLPALVAALGHEDAAVRRAAACVLADVEGVAPHLLRRLDGERDPAARVGLLVALGRRPGERAGLESRLGVEHPAVDRFGAAFALVADLGPDAAVPGPVLDALVLCVAGPGAAMGELPWSGLAGDAAVHQVRAALAPAPAATVGWLARMLALPWTAEPPTAARPTAVCAFAADLYRKEPGHGAALAPALTDLLGHPDTSVRRAAAVSVKEWAHAGHEPPDPRVRDLVECAARALDDPALARIVVELLVGLRDRRALPALRAMLAGPLGQGDIGLIRSAPEFAADLGSDLAARLRTETEPGRIVDLATADPSGRLVPEIGEALARLHREAGDPPDARISEALGSLCAALGTLGDTDDRVLAALHQVIGGRDLELRKTAVRALTALGGPAAEVVPVLVSLITDHPARSAAGCGPAADRQGWRIDAAACAWLGELGVRAAAAEPLLRALLEERDPEVEIRADAAKALWRITGDADTAIRVLVAQIPFAGRPEHVVHDLELMGAAAAPALPVLDELAAGGSELAWPAERAAQSIRAAG